MKKSIRRKTISILFALVLTLSMSVTALANDTTVNQDSTEQTGKTSVSYEVSPTYTVTIPATVTLGNGVTISASGVVVPEGKQVTVKITGTSDSENAFKVQNETSSGGTGTDTLTYTVKDSDSKEYSLSDTVLTVNPANSDTGSVLLTFALADGETPTYSGTYSGTMTFTVSLDDVS